MCLKCKVQLIVEYTKLKQSKTALTCLNNIKDLEHVQIKDSGEIEICYSFIDSLLNQFGKSVDRKEWNYTPMLESLYNEDRKTLDTAIKLHHLKGKFEDIGTSHEDPKIVEIKEHMDRVGGFPTCTVLTDKGVLQVYESETMDWLFDF